jgi:oxygen-independent coproporphyrinogen III oxidase
MSGTPPQGAAGHRAAAARQAVRTLYPGYFALVMATGIVSIAAWFLDMKAVAWALFALNNGFYLVLWVLTLARLALYPADFAKDLTSHTSGPAFLTLVAGTCVLGTQYEVLSVSAAFALALWGLGAVLWVVLIYTFFTSVTIRPVKPPLEDGLNGAWLLAVVSTQSVSLLGTLLAPHFGGAAEAVLFTTLCLYLLGCMLYLLIIALIFYRFTFLTLKARDLSPPYWINMGAVAITTMAGVRLLLRAPDWTLLAELRPFLAGFTLFFWATATWWIPLLLILGEWRHVVKRFPLTYHPAYWAIVFPLGMYTAATFLLARALDLPFLLVIPRLFIHVAIVAWAVVFAGMAARLGPRPVPAPSESRRAGGGRSRRPSARPQTVRATMRYELTPGERATYRRYAGLALPRHTSYPIAPVWATDYGPAAFRADLRRSADHGRPLSLYVHVPYCERLCYYCACTKEIVPPAKRRQHDPGDEYLRGLGQEAGRFAELVGPGAVHQVHLGGGSPTFLSAGQLERLGHILNQCFAIAPGAEIAVEIDPRITSREQLQMLRGLSFNRVSLGVQDFAPQVQLAVNRVQPVEVVARAVEWCRELGFASVNFDLIYGLPYQTLDSMAGTLEQVIQLAPDRVAFYRLAVIPEMFRWQNVFKPADLPAGDLPLELNLLAINRFREAGYEFIGLDHFAKPAEGLAQASKHATLHRTFQGMTTGKDLDLIALGPSAISQLDDAFAQNVKASADWRAAAAEDFATERGLRLSADDRLRRELLQQLYGYGAIDKRSLEERFDITFDEYFAGERGRLADLVGQGLVEPEADVIRLAEPLGRLLVRVVAAVFDRYLPPTAYRDGLPAHQSSKVG